MPDKILSILTEFRFWRASVPVGMTIAVAAALAATNASPDLVDPENVFSPVSIELTSALGAIPVWAFVITSLLLAGSWWCAIAAYSVTLIQRLLLKAIPLDTDPDKWSRLQRIALPLPTTHLRDLQSLMRGTHEYGDLETRDRAGAYRSFLADVVREPHSAIDTGTPRGLDAVRALSDARLTAGLLIWIPLIFVLASWHVLPNHQPVATFLRFAATLSFVSLLVGTWAQARRSTGLLLVTAATPERLATHARLAVGSGRSAAEVEAANESLD